MDPFLSVKAVSAWQLLFDYQTLDFLALASLAPMVGKKRGEPKIAHARNLTSGK